MCILWSLQPEKSKKSPLSYTQQQPSYLPPIRNPFKAPEKKDKDADWRKMQSGGSATKNKEARLPAEGHETRQKENVDVTIAENELEPKSNISVTFRGKHLPPGMKLKKKVSNEDKNSPKENGVRRSDDDHRGPEEAERSISTSLAEGVPAGKPRENTQNLQKDSALKKPTDDKTSIKLSKSTADKTLDESSPSSFTQASTDSSTSGRISDKPSQPTDSHPSNKGQDDDDDVVLVSVKPAAQKSATAVQKALTTFPGFQPASKVKSEEDPRGLRGLFTTQLQQVQVRVKDTGILSSSILTIVTHIFVFLSSFLFSPGVKQTLSVVNVAALPDKGERLRTQVRQLEEALASLSLAQASPPGCSLTLQQRKCYVYIWLQTAKF